MTRQAVNKTVVNAVVNGAIVAAVVLWTGQADAGTTGIWQPIADFIRGFIGLLYLLGGAAILGLLAYAGFQMYGQQEFGGLGRGFAAIASAVVLGIGLYVILPTYVNQAIAQGATLEDVQDE